MCNKKVATFVVVYIDKNASSVKNMLIKNYSSGFERAGSGATKKMRLRKAL